MSAEVVSAVSSSAPSVNKPRDKPRMSRHDRKLMKRGTKVTNATSTDPETKDDDDDAVDDDEIHIDDWMDASLSVPQTMEALEKIVRDPAFRVHGKNIVFTVRHNDRSYSPIKCDLNMNKAAFTYPKGSGSWYVNDFDNKNVDRKHHQVYSIVSLIPRMFQWFLTIDNDALHEMYPRLVVSDIDADSLNDAQYKEREMMIKKLKKTPATFIIEIYDTMRDPDTKRKLFNQSHFIVVEP